MYEAEQGICCLHCANRGLLRVRLGKALLNFPYCVAVDFG